MHTQCHRALRVHCLVGPLRGVGRTMAAQQAAKRCSGTTCTLAAKCTHKTPLAGDAARALPLLWQHSSVLGQIPAGSHKSSPMGRVVGDWGGDCDGGGGQGGGGFWKALGLDGGHMWRTGAVHSGDEDGTRPRQRDRTTFTRQCRCWPRCCDPAAPTLADTATRHWKRHCDVWAKRRAPRARALSSSRKTAPLEG